VAILCGAYPNLGRERFFIDSCLPPRWNVPWQTWRSPGDTRRGRR
jgi:hypothetical protein